jgi:hypothetical protein
VCTSTGLKEPASCSTRVKEVLTLLVNSKSLCRPRMYVLTFLEGKLVKIETGGYGQ